MRLLILCLALLAAGASHAQNDFPQPKLRYSVGFLSARYELGDQDATAQQVRDHLQTTSQEAYQYWQKADGHNLAGSVLGLVGAVGLLVGVLSKSDTGKILGYGSAAAGFGASAVFTFTSAAHRERAVNTYNFAYGYR
jgi:hypothetical protein